MSQYTTTPTLDMIWLELSQFVSAKTHREIALEKETERMREALARIRTHCADNDAENWIWRTAEQALKAGGQ